MRQKIIFLFFALLLGGCASKPGAPAQLNTSATSKSSAVDGRSFENAIVIQADHSSLGVKEEYAWIRTHIPKGKPIGQKLLGHGPKMYDVVQVKLPDGSIRDVYFDISSFFGKF